MPGKPEEDSELTGRRDATGSLIPDDAFENDCRAPDPDLLKKRYGEGFLSEMKAKLAERAKKARSAKDDDAAGG